MLFENCTIGIILITINFIVITVTQLSIAGKKFLSLIGLVGRTILIIFITIFIRNGKNLHHIRHYCRCHRPSCWGNNLHNRCLESGPDRHQNHPLGKNLHRLRHHSRCHLPSRRRNNLHNRCLESGLDSHQNNPRRNILQLPSVFSSTLLFHPVTSQK